MTSRVRASLRFCATLLLVVTLANGKCTVNNQRVQCGSLTCDADTGLCTACVNKSQCWESVMQCIDGECLVGPLLQTGGLDTVVAMLCTVLVCAVAVVAGIGGGGILVPMYAAVTDMPMIAAVGLSQAAIVGQSAFNMWFVARRTIPTMTPNEVRPLVNFQYLSMLLPLGLMGTLMGSALSKIVPDWLRVVLLFTLLTSLLHRVIERARKQFKSEGRGSPSAAKAERSVSADATDSEPNVRLSTVNATSPPTTALAATEVAPVPEEPVRLRPHKRELVLCVASFFTLLAFNVLRTRFTTCGSAMYTVLFVVPLFILLGITVFARRMLSTVRDNVVSGYLTPDHLTFHWSFRTTVVFPLVAVVAGAAASMLGIGGGLVLSFVLYEAGLVPEEASATSGFATLTIASESALQMVFQGQLVLDYGCTYSAMGVLSTCLGQFVFMKYIRERRAQFLIVVALAVIVGGSLVALTSYGIYDMIELLREDGSLLAFGHLCKATPTR